MLPNLVWFLVDGLSYELVREYSTARPNSKLAALWNNHRVSPLTPLYPNCQTPPSLFTIWSGSDTSVHKLLGYDIPISIDNNPINFTNGFISWPYEQKMVWDLYAEEKKNIRTCAVPFIQPTRLEPWLLSSTDVFSPSKVEMGVFSDEDVITIDPLNLVLHIKIYKKIISLVDNSGSVYWFYDLSSAQKEKPLSITSCTIGETNFAIRLRAAVIDGQLKLICLGYHPIFVHGSATKNRREIGQYQPYVVANPGKLYAAGLLGLRIDEGGEGNAERLLVSLMRDVHDSFANDIIFAIKSKDADLVVGYYPVIDLLSHQLLDYAFGASNKFNGPLAEVFMQAIDWLDLLLVELAENIDSDMSFIINSDHGMIPVAWDIYPNTFFIERGWLNYDENGKINPHDSLVFFHPAENGLLVFNNHQLIKLGLTYKYIFDELQTAVSIAGLDGLSIINGISAELGTNWLDYLYLQSPPRSRFRAAQSDNLVQRSRKGGDHTVYSSAPWLCGVLMDAGKKQYLASGLGSLKLTQLLPLITGSQSESKIHYITLSNLNNH